MQTLAFRNMGKAYGGVPALQDVSLSLHAGRIHALMGENGAGKSTLIKLIAGVVPADSLEITCDGRSVPLASARDAQNAGFRFIHQELNIVPQVSVAENVLLGRLLPRRFGLAVDWRAARTLARQALQALGAGHIDPRALAGDLPTGDQMLVRIAAALVSDQHTGDAPLLYVLDEPTAALTDAESDRLFAVIDRLAATGAAVLYVSHRMDEVLRICHDVTVLRDGRHVSTRAVAETSKDQIIRDMTGRDVKDAYPKAPAAPDHDAPIIADLSQITTPRLSNISFDLRAGDILGIAGLAAAGQSEVLELFMGVHPVLTGTARICGAPLPKAPHEAWARGIAYLPRERRRDGLMLDMSIRANITAAHLDRYGLIAKPAQERRDARARADTMRLKYDHIDQPVGQLSGGNQQKVLFARALYGAPKLLLLDEPTRGVDIGAKFDIYTTVRAASAQGCAVILTSSDLPEMLGMCDRILVLQDGVQTAMVPTRGLTSSALLSRFYAPERAA